MRGLVLAATLVAGLMAGPANAQYLTLGGDDMDACASNGVVVGLKANGDNFLAVRKGPGTRHAKIDELRNGDEVFICTGDGAWMGIVYGGRDCGVSSPIVPARIYRGPCRSGWVHQDFIEVTAG